ncbi:MAG: 50S ribosomal protein L18 [Candidatus Woesebacteria bacterium GW2011_GWA1_41_13b]|uniref:Large ribosomal subunit protein uL18 n=1 Tax=Candidatus Woesebacteria bacterium GW2011_GWA1_41_13b TaxID=1618555 RepID=A0A0G0X5R7_9BACT|nr:MAG: 50S ribosomal protein L18 [Candidatus Woesebacteria bacterium GW2011_GWA1_41_13b]
MITRYKKSSQRRAVRTRNKVRGSSDRPRLSVFRSNKYIWAQVIDDSMGKTLAAAGGKKPAEVGKTIAERALKAKIKRIVFDRGAYRYHGQVKILAEAAREGGMEF